MVGLQNSFQGSQMRASDTMQYLKLACRRIEAVLSMILMLRYMCQRKHGIHILELVMLWNIAHVIRVVTDVAAYGAGVPEETRP